MKKWNTLVIIMSVILLLAAIIHRFQLGAPDSAYTKSVLVQVEWICLLALFLLNAISLLIGIGYAFIRKWGNAGQSILFSGVSIILIVSAFIIDAPTLIYMT